MLTLRTGLVPLPAAGEIVQDVILSTEEVARFNEAREAFKMVKALYWAHVVPGLGGFDNPVVGELERQLEVIVFASRNFLWPHRNAAAFHEARDVGGAA